MFVNFNEETQHILKQAGKEMMELNHPYVGSEHLLLAILKETNSLTEKLKAYHLTYEVFKEKLISLIGKGSNSSKFILYTPLLKKVLENAVSEAREENNSIVNPEILIISILDEEDGIAFSILKSLRINVEKLYYDIKTRTPIKPNKKKKLLLEELGTNLTKLAKEKKLDPVIGREKEINSMMEILMRRKKNNPILIGPAGVGKTAIVEHFASLVIQNKVPEVLKNKVIIALNIYSLVAGTKYRGEFEDKMKNIIRELEDNKDIILFIDELHTIVGAGGAEGAIDASNIFKPALARGSIKVIGATTLDEYKKYIEPDAALDRRFQKVFINEPDKKMVIKILRDIKPLYESYHLIKISDEQIINIVNLTEKYVSERYEPDRSIDILDEVCAKVAITESRHEKQKNKIVKQLNVVQKEKSVFLINKDFKGAYRMKEREKELRDKLRQIKVEKKEVGFNDIINIIREKTLLPLLEYDLNRNQFYDKLKLELNEKILGVSPAINELILSLKRNEYIKNKNTCNTILITGPIGTGKTLLAETYAKEIVRSKNIINLDMSEYNESHTISKLIGTTAGYLGYDNKNNVFEKVRTKPHSIFILDNIENASVEVLNLFTRIFEKSTIEDASGKNINFKNCTFIMTTSISSDKESLGFNSSKANNTLIKYFPLNFINKINTIINLNRLNSDNINQVINKKINEILEKYKMFNKEGLYSLNTIIEKINYNENGFSKLDGILKEEVESKIVDNLISMNS
ncbi:MAG: ATP-dependent Clp protease ATP-binding subunit [Bacilli bacterium]